MKTSQNTQPPVPRPTRPAPPAMHALTLGATVLWSAVMLVTTVLWGAGILDAPFGDAQPGEFTSLLDKLSVPLGAGLVGFCALVSFAVAAVLLTLPRLRRPAVPVVGVMTVGLSLITTIVFTDTLLLAYLGYLLSFQFPPIPVPIIWQAVLLAGPVLWLAVWASLGAQNRTGTDPSQMVPGSGNDGGRSDDGPADVAGRGRVSTSAKVAVVIAVTVPAFYAFTRILWAAGIPLGLTDELYTEGNKVGMWQSGLALAIAALVGALLTLGLVQRWGERLPRWTGPLASRRVPISLATIPASIVALALFTGGAGLVRDGLLGGMGPGGADPASNWATTGPTYLFPVWALALGWATYTYRARRLTAESRR